MRINGMPPLNPSFGWSIRTQTTKYGKNISTWSEYMMDNGKKLVTVHNSVNGKKVAISKTLYDGYKILKEKVVQFIDGKKKVTRIV